MTQKGSFRIEANMPTVAQVTDDGEITSSEYAGDSMIYWNDESKITCELCNYESIVALFEEGL